MTFLSKREWMFVAFILIYSFVPTFGGLLRIGELLGGVSFIPENSRAIAAPFPIVLHIVSSFCFCIFGAHQFLPSVRRLHSSRHRAAGKLVAGAGCVSALTGLWMTVSFPIPQELQGTLLFSARILLGSANGGGS